MTCRQGLAAPARAVIDERSARVCGNPHRARTCPLTPERAQDRGEDEHGYLATKLDDFNLITGTRTYPASLAVLFFFVHSPFKKDGQKESIFVAEG